LDLLNKTIDFFCIQEINAGDEITVNYNGEAGDEKPVWFDKKND
jgi:SET domain-containing protein